MESIKKLEYFSLLLALGIIAAGSFLKSIPFALLIFGFGLLVQGYIIYLYKKNNMIQVYLKNKAGALIGGILLIAFFLLKDGIWDLSQLFFLCACLPQAYLSAAADRLSAFARIKK